MNIPSEYLRQDKIKGIGKIENTLTKKVYLYSSFDVIKSFTDLRFSLDMGTFKIKELQDDYEKIGLELFTLSLDYECKSDENEDEALKKRIKFYTDKGVELYNN